MNPDFALDEDNTVENEDSISRESSPSPPATATNIIGRPAYECSVVLKRIDRDLLQPPPNSGSNKENIVTKRPRQDFTPFEDDILMEGLRTDQEQEHRTKS